MCFDFLKEKGADSREQRHQRSEVREFKLQTAESREQIVDNRDGLHGECGRFRYDSSACV